MPPQVMTPLKTKRLLVCEGVEDAQLLRALIAERKLGAFDVRWVQDLGGTPGNSGFRDALTGVVSLTNFRNIKHVCLISDCDDHYGKSFANVCKQIVDANADTTVAARFYVPTLPYSTVGGSPKVSVAMIPAANQKGALETLVLEAMRELKHFNQPLKCAEGALDCAGIKNKWQTQKLDKATMITALAIYNGDDPSISLSRLWNRQPELIPLTCKAFDGLAKYLASINT